MGKDVSIYRIVVEGHLGDDWADWFGRMIVDLHVTPMTTELSVRVPDQAALHGILAGIRDLNLPLLLVRRLPETVP